jgi:hypothetical protein
MPLSCLFSMVRSFVVQFHADASVSERRLAGRVEHLRTGDAVHFESLEDLLRFMETHIEGDRDLSPGNPALEEYQK